MSEIDNGGPAFPHEFGATYGPWTAGMTLRDYFAAKAMQAAATEQKGADNLSFTDRAEWAYAQADAMLEARKS